MIQLHHTGAARPSRRRFLASTAAGLALAGASPRRSSAAAPGDRARIAITLDLEMSRHYPTWDQTHWDYEKGNLDAPTKRYAVEAARRVRARGGRIHFFALGRTLEQEDVGWLRTLVDDGHPVGNHTYDHVNVKATTLPDVQFRFRRAPWLVEGKTPAQVISDNIRMMASALKERIGIEPAGFRTPGGFSNGLADRPDLQAMLLKLGYTWVSSKYPAHPLGEPGREPAPEVRAAIAAAQKQAQPYVYPSGLVEVPMNPVSDVTALRSGKWPLDAFLETTRAGVAWAIENRAVFDFLAHPSCLVVADPEFRAIELICDLVNGSGGRAELTDLATIARQVREENSPQRHEGHKGGKDPGGG
jgi:peptidoglycan/xylan/chitin deacetylase (PgdA/CDA1 family)